MESALEKPALVGAKPTAKTTTVIYWVVTGLFCLQMGFTAYAQLRLPQVAEAFKHLGFPAYFRVELSLAKMLGVVLLLRAGAAAPQGVGLRRLRHRHRLGHHRARRVRRRRAGVGLGGGDRNAVGALVRLLAPLAGDAGTPLR